MPAKRLSLTFLATMALVVSVVVSACSSQSAQQPATSSQPTQAASSQKPAAEPEKKPAASDKPVAEKKAEAVPGVTADSILLGSYQPMTGNESAYFRMGKGADAYYKYVNENGGVNGRKINFKMVDDGYQPAKTTAVVKQFVEQDHVFAIADPLGTAPTMAVVDYIVDQKVPLIGPGSGASKVVNSTSKYVFPLYPNYVREGQVLAKFAQQNFKATKLAMIYQNDQSGKDDLSGLQEGAQKNNQQVVSTQGYEVKDVDVSAQVLKVKEANPDALVVFAAPEHFAKILTERKKLGWNVPTVASFVGLDDVIFKLAGPDAANGVYISTIFKLPDSDDPQIKQFREIMKKYYPQEEPSLIHMWGYAGAQVTVEGLKRAGKDLTRDNFISALETLKDWDGSLAYKVTLAPGKHLIQRSLGFVQAQNGKFKMSGDFVEP